MKGLFKKLGFVIESENNKNVNISQQSVLNPNEQHTQFNNQQQPITEMVPFNDISSQSKTQQVTTSSSSSSPQQSHDIIVVNPTYKKSSSSYYHSKYTPLISRLTPSKPILIQHDKMNITFDKDIISYLFTDITTIFNEKSSIIDQHQKQFLSSIQQTHDLINIHHDIHSNPIHNTSNSFKRHEMIMEDIDSLERIINNLNETADNLLNELNTLESQLHK